MLEGKKIVFIAPKFFDYEAEIKKELECLGAIVYFIDDRMQNDTLTKTLIRLKLAKNIARRRVEKYFAKHLNQIKVTKTDYLFAITPEGFSKKIIQKYRAELPEAAFILYMWDSMANRPYTRDVLSLFDRRFSFDRNDVTQFTFTFRPLFYTPAYSNIRMQTRQKNRYDVSFVGTAHSDRYLVIRNFEKLLLFPVRSFFYFYLQHPLLILYYRVTDRNFRKVKVKDISFKGLTQTDVLEIVANSKAIIDINHPKQLGLTMRTIECIGAGKKLITTNSDVLNYDFYRQENILVIDRNHPSIDHSFLNSSYKEIEDNLYYKYSLRGFIKDIFES